MGCTTTPGLSCLRFTGPEKSLGAPPILKPGFFFFAPGAKGDLDFVLGLYLGLGLLFLVLLLFFTLTTRFFFAPLAKGLKDEEALDLASLALALDLALALG